VSFDPDQCRFAKLKLARAAKQIEAIQDIVWDCLGDEPSSISKHMHSEYTFKVAPSPQNAAELAFRGLKTVVDVA
jgi:hypothetical protein